MKDASANNLVERLAKLADPFDRKPMKAQVSDVVLLLKFTGMTQARFADVDRGDARVGLRERVTRGLRRAAASDKDGSIWPQRLQWPQQQILRAPPLRIAVALEALLEALNRRRIGVRLIERANRIDAVSGRFRVLTRCWHPLRSSLP